MCILKCVLAAGAVSVIAMCVSVAMIGAGLIAVLSGFECLIRGFLNDQY